MGGVEKGEMRGCGQLAQDGLVDVISVGRRVAPQEVVDCLQRGGSIDGRKFSANLQNFTEWVEHDRTVNH